MRAFNWLSHLLLGWLTVIDSAASSSDLAAARDVQAPLCGSSVSVTRSVAYYQSWNTHSFGCNKVWPNQLNVDGFTHLIMAYITIDPDTFHVHTMHSGDEELYQQFLALPGSVSKWIGVVAGGGDFKNPGPAFETWSQLISSQDHRTVFIASLKQFLTQWNFRGVDIDWHWPTYSGAFSDADGQLALLKELREALGRDFGLSAVVPPQQRYLQHLDIKAVEAQVDWLTVQTRDLHGAWESSSEGLKAHADYQEIDGLLSNLSSTGIDPKKLNLAIANYARGYTLVDKKCDYWSCPSRGHSRPGQCTLQIGVLSECELVQAVNDGRSAPWQVIPGGAKTNWMAWDDQWFNFDDGNSRRLKLELANQHCMGGTSLWSIDYGHCNVGTPTPGPSSPAAPSQPATSVPPPPPVEPSGSSTPANSVPSSQDSSITSAWSARSTSAQSSPISESAFPSSGAPTLVLLPGSIPSDSPSSFRQASSTSVNPPGSSSSNVHSSSGSDPSSTSRAPPAVPSAPSLSQTGQPPAASSQASSSSSSSVGTPGASTTGPNSPSSQPTWQSAPTFGSSITQPSSPISLSSGSSPQVGPVPTTGESWRPSRSVGTWPVVSSPVVPSSIGSSTTGSLPTFIPVPVPVPSLSGQSSTPLSSSAASSVGSSVSSSQVSSVGSLTSDSASASSPASSVGSSIPGSSVSGSSTTGSLPTFVPVPVPVPSLPGQNSTPLSSSSSVAPSSTGSQAPTSVGFSSTGAQTSSAAGSSSTWSQASSPVGSSSVSSGSAWSQFSPSYTSAQSAPSFVSSPGFSNSGFLSIIPIPIPVITGPDGKPTPMPSWTSTPANTLPQGPSASTTIPPGNTPGNTPSVVTPPGNTSPGSTPPGNTPPGNTPPGVNPPVNTPSGHTPPGNTPPGNTPPDVTPPAPSSPGNTPPGNTLPGNTSPGNTSPTDSNSGSATGTGTGSVTGAGSASGSATGSGAGSGSASKTPEASGSGAASASASASKTHEASQVAGRYCPPECKEKDNKDWCEKLCDDEHGIHLEIDIPKLCFNFWWCLLWYGHKIPLPPKPKCKLLGCGCGFLGLPFPRCPGNKGTPEEDLLHVKALFPDVDFCHWFGCDGGCGILGCDGFCFGPDGCDPCPDWICPGRKPKPGLMPKPPGLPTPPPAPNPTGPPPNPTAPPPPEKPTKCGPEAYKTYTERVLYCGEFKWLSSSLSMSTVTKGSLSLATTSATTATSTSTSCFTALDFTLTGCDMPKDHVTTISTTMTFSNTLNSTSDAPACTRAPLSLDDDEGPNDPPDWLSTPTFASNTTMGSPSTPRSESMSTPLSTTLPNPWFGSNSTTTGSTMASATGNSSSLWASVTSMSNSTMLSSSATPTSKSTSMWSASSSSTGNGTSTWNPSTRSTANATSTVGSSTTTPSDSTSIGSSSATSSLKTASSASSPMTFSSSSSPAPSSSSGTSPSSSLGTSSSSNAGNSSSLKVAPSATNPVSFPSTTSWTQESSVPIATSVGPPPAPSAGSMDRFGKWNVSCHQWLENQSSKLEWTLYDPNGYQAGYGKMMPVEGKSDYKRSIESQDRPEQHMMPFNVSAWNQHPTDPDKARVWFHVDKVMSGCGVSEKDSCSPWWKTETRLDQDKFEVESCYDYCKDPKDVKLLPSDINCDDNNVATWEKTSTGGWERKFWCWFKAF